ncbi:unnamed protein product [Schistosoma margrebowiei]|uniref:Uncharacterized protein n=1 Tax=Schistosoma margrebowiei TaxID=48269 RepID=A0AA85ALZ6_9TREM|nr:unnamed protein product [Schistosoma margrebowiei]
MKYIKMLIMMFIVHIAMIQIVQSGGDMEKTDNGNGKVDVVLGSNGINVKKDGESIVTKIKKPDGNDKLTGINAKKDGESIVTEIEKPDGNDKLSGISVKKDGESIVTKVEKPGGNDQLSG